MGEIKKVGILSAMPQENRAFNLAHQRHHWHKKRIELGLTGVGKSAAAAKTAEFIVGLEPDLLIFTGVAGSLDDSLEIGDIGIVQYAIDADLDVRVWKESPEAEDYLRGQLPFTRERVFQSDPYLVEQALKAPTDLNDHWYEGALEDVKLFEGYVATGSAFLAADGKKDFNEKVNPDLEAELDGIVRRPNLYDMETSAVLQVANAYKTPALVIRAVSDTTRGDSPKDFNEFVKNVIDSYVPIVSHILKTVDYIGE
jgi:adenosylhomocysteine nucleosidase